MQATIPTTIRNETPCNLELTGFEGKQLLLSPLEARQMKEDELKDFDLSAAKSRGLIKQLEEPPSEAFAKISGYAGVALFLLFWACLTLSGISEPPFFKSVWPQFVWIAGVTLLGLIALIAALTISN